MLMSEGHSEDLQRHMYKLYQDGEMCDLEIFSRDGITFRAHRLVLTASSRHLHNLCIQSADCTSYQFDIGSEALHVLLEFCYTGQLFVTVERWRDVQDAAVLLQMYNVLELLNKQSRKGTSHDYQEVGNQTVLAPHDNSSTIDSQSRASVEIVPFNSQFKLEGQTEMFDNDILGGDQNQQEIIVKQEIPVLHEEGNQLGKSAEDKRRNVKVTHYRTRSGSKKDKITNSIENCLEESKKVDLDNEPRQKKKPVAFTGIKGRRNSAKVTNGDDPDYEPETKSAKKVKVRKRNDIKTRSKVSSSEDKNRRILAKIKNSKIEKTVGQERKRKRGCRRFHKIFMPQSSSKKCPDCNKTFMSSVLLHRHQLCVHFSKNCSQLKHNHIVKLSKQKSNTYSCIINQGILNKSLKFECKLCKAKFSKYCLFTMHHRKKHSNNARPFESWLRYCSVKLAMQKLLVPFAKDRKSNSGSVAKSKANPKKHRERTFKCTACNKMLLTQYTLESHKKNMHGDTSGRVIIRREKVVPPEPLFVCSECRKSKGTIRALNNHLQMKHGYTSREANRLQHCVPDSLGCEICEFKTHNLQEMKEHVTEMHSFLKYQCTDCPLSFKVLLLMKRHRFMCHIMGKYNFHCQHCSKSFRKGSVLRKHEYFKHGVPHDNIKIFYCEHPGCSYKTYASTAIKLHQSKHVTEKLFPCEYCGSKLKTKSIHEKHVAKMHLGIRPFLCQVCGLSFGEKHELQSHITNKHSNERNYQCQYCSYRTAVKSTFFTHMFNVHKVRAEDDKRELFSCPHCPFTSILKYRYQTHVNGHTNTRNYECKICNKSFVSANTLRSHKQWVHSDKVYSCTQCDYQTKTTQKLNEHIRVQHQLQGFKPYKCPYCTFRCATGGNTRKHVKQVHKGQEVTYLRDDDLLTAARMARASGHYASLLNTLSSVQLSHEVSEDERSELSENILHIAL